MYSLGIDVGTSSVKVSLLDIRTGNCVDSSTNPKSEAPIIALRKGWAEQDPESWWDYTCEGIREIASRHPVRDIASIGITYQMHGLVCIDRNGRPVRNSIIWCDSRAAGIGARALEEIGYEKCMSHLLNSPGNFTASKLAWVKRNEPETYERVWKIMLPGDWIAYKLSGELSTTGTGLSEGIMWDFKENSVAGFVLEHYGIEPDKLPGIVPSIGVQVRTCQEAFELLGIKNGTPICYRAGDQPNNAFSLNVLNPGEVAATGGTSGVVYGVTDIPKADPASRVNTFLHVNDTDDAHRYGVLLCISGTGIMNAWMRRNVCPQLNYQDMNRVAATAAPGSDGLTLLPFGNGIERMLGNKATGAEFIGLDLVRHNTATMLRATQEGIAFSFLYGMEIMKNLGLDLSVIRAGKANMFLNPIFCTTLSTVSGASIELFNTDGALGAARGAALGAGFYNNEREAFETLCKEAVIGPEENSREALLEAYGKWKNELESRI